jgi:putative (di)nucleoside polyphosphate hydrolase
MIDADGFRPNVAIVLLRDDGRVFWARRVHRDGWQFPQGGMRSDETPEEAMLRELREETGLRPEHVELIASTPGWLRYRLPKHYVRRGKPYCIGQKQVWFLLRFVGEESDFQLDASEKPEFDEFRWVDFWYPLGNVVAFKRRVYELALGHLSKHAKARANIADPPGALRLPLARRKRVQRGPYGVQAARNAANQAGAQRGLRPA